MHRQARQLHMAFFCAYGYTPFIVWTHNEMMISDHERLRLISRNKPDLAKNLIGLFLRELPNLKSEIDRAYIDSDSQQLAEACHKLKSAVGNFVTQDFYQEVSRLESTASNAALADWQQQWQAADQKLQVLTEELHSLCR